MRQAGAEALLLESGAQIHACPIEHPGQRIPLPDPGLHTPSGARLQHDGRRLVRFQLSDGTIRLLFHVCDVEQPILSLGCLAQQGCWSDLRADTGTLFFLDRIQKQHSQIQLHKEDRLFFVKGKLMAPLVTAGVSDGVAQELHMPTGPQALEDTKVPMPSRLATLEDPGTPDQIVLDQHNLTHFPSLSWCKVCVEFRGRDSPRREQSKRDAVVPQLPFECGYMGDRGPLQIACFLVGTDTSSRPMFATMVSDSKKMDMPYVVAGTAKCVTRTRRQRRSVSVAAASRHMLRATTSDVWKQNYQHGFNSSRKDGQGYPKDLQTCLQLTWPYSGRHFLLVVPLTNPERSIERTETERY